MYSDIGLTQVPCESEAHPGSVEIKRTEPEQPNITTSDQRR